jgi:hypothetical protein
VRNNCPARIIRVRDKLIMHGKAFCIRYLPSINRFVGIIYLKWCGSVQERLTRGGLKDQTSYTYYPGTVRLPPQSQPHTRNRSHRITAEVEIPADGKVESPICALGGLGAGWSMYIKDRIFIYCLNCMGEVYYVRSEKEVPAGKKCKASI